MSSSPTRVETTINDAQRTLTVESNELLLDTLRDRLGLRGAKRSCDVQVCGTCTVLVDGEPVSACTYLTSEAAGREVLTIEGFAARPEFAEFERAFVERAAVQCGFCTPGMMLTMKALRDGGELSDQASLEAGLDGSICRCTGYRAILQAAGDLAAPQEAVR
jgi:aerobic-type carbon monoxide dehydrogenase small subunit (CoxS/CutS family)